MAIEFAPSVILGQRIADLMKESGITKVEGHSALHIAGVIWLDTQGVSFSADGEGE